MNTRALARKVVGIYSPHTQPFDGEVLRQNAGGQAEIVTLISRFRSRSVGDSTLPLAAARHAAPDEFETLVRLVEYKLIEMPLGRLQVVGKGAEPFIYTLGWSDTPKRSEVVQDAFEGRLHLFPHARRHLLRSSALIHPMVQRTWALTVSPLNGLQDHQLDAFLFGEGRLSLKPITPGLRELAHAGVARRRSLSCVPHRLNGRGALDLVSPRRAAPKGRRRSPRSHVAASAGRFAAAGGPVPPPLHDAARSWLP